MPWASCAVCSDKTAKIEHRVLRQSYGFRETRSALRIGKRRRKEKPTDALIETENPEGRIKKLVPLSVHPLPLVLPLLATPTVLSKRRDPKGVRVRGYHNYSAGNEPQAILSYLGEEKIYVKGRNYDHDFAKLIAKIAWCSWVSSFGLQSLVETWLPAVILGDDESVGKYVGTLDYAIAGLVQAPCLHSVHLALWNNDGNWIAVARVQFFLQLTPCPTYFAFIGRLGDRLNTDADPTKWMLPRQGMIGRPLSESIPRWVGTVLFGKREDGAGSDILDELRALGLID